MTITEIAPDVFRLSIFVRAINLQFNQFVVRDEEPLLYHTGMRRMFPEVVAGVKQLIDPARLRWIGYSHFEVDECGALNEWLNIAPQAEAVTGFVGALVNLNDFATRPARALSANETFATGQYRFRYLPTPHLPHGWDAGVMFEETNRTLLCSDLFHQQGDVEPLTQSDVIGRVRAAMTEYQAGPLMDYMPFTSRTGLLLERLAELQPRTLAAMHGSTFVGDGARALRDLRIVMREVLGEGN